MKTFSYVAAPASGSNERGTIRANDVAHAVDQLIARGLTPVELNDGVARSPWWMRDIAVFGKYQDRRAVLHFVEALALLLRAKVPLPAAVRFARDTNPSRSMRSSLDQVSASLQDGANLADALMDHAKTLPSAVRASLSIGEKANDLAATAAVISQSLRRSEARRKQVSSALIYPAILGIMSLALVGMLTFYLTPNLTPVFAATGADVPFAIATLDAVRRALTTHETSIPIFAGALMIIVGLVVAISSGWHKPLLRRWPLYRRLDQLNLSYEFCSTCNLMLGNGALITEAVRVAHDSSRDSAARRGMKAAIDEIAAGATLSASLQGQTWLEPSAFALIETGEESNNLTDVMAIAATEMDQRASELTERLARLLTPLLTIIIGLFVGSIILSTITGIMTINDISI